MRLLSPVTGPPFNVWVGVCRRISYEVREVGLKNYLIRQVSKVAIHPIVLVVVVATAATMSGRGWREDVIEIPLVE
jgi:hypothetical protein